MGIRTTDRDMLEVEENTEFRLPGAAATSQSNIIIILDIHKGLGRLTISRFSEDTDSIACRATCDLCIQN